MQIMAEGPHRRRGRPRLAVPPQIYYIKLRLYPGQDDDLIAFLATVPPRWRSAAVKIALRTGNTGNTAMTGPEEDAVTDALDALLL